MTSNKTEQSTRDSLKDFVPERNSIAVAQRAKELLNGISRSLSLEAFAIICAEQEQKKIEEAVVKAQRKTFLELDRKIVNSKEWNEEQANYLLGLTSAFCEYLIGNDKATAYMVLKHSHKETSVNREIYSWVLEENKKINMWALNQIKACKLCKLNKTEGWSFCLEHVDDRALTEEKAAIKWRELVERAKKEMGE
jgi:hypothetical protein